ncbi:MAG: hypothetical protein N4A31_06505 [Rickettsiales bacterium]|jgi:two-component sensor histidine kinase|nr:hypothetical protein [Rickettsiales bacterium]
MEGLDIDSYLYDIESGGLEKLQEVANYTMGSPYAARQVIGGINTSINQLKKILEDSYELQRFSPDKTQTELVTKLVNKIKNNFSIIQSYTRNSNLSSNSERECNKRISRFEAAMFGVIKSLNKRGMSLDVHKAKTEALPKKGEPYYVENWSPDRPDEFKMVESRQSYIEHPSSINDHIGNIINRVESLQKDSIFPSNSVGSQLLEDVKGNANNIKEKVEVVEKESANRIQEQIISQLMDRMQNKFLLVQKQLSYQSSEARDGSTKDSISKIEMNVIELAKVLNQKGMSLDLDKFTPRFIPPASKLSSEELGKWSSKAREESFQSNDLQRVRQ